MKKQIMTETVAVFAPATSANVAVGFDILGFPLDAVGDTVQLRRCPEPKVIIRSISGVVSHLPLMASQNVAGLVLERLIADLDLDFGFELDLIKGIPLSSGMGGSAASAVAALFAANMFLPDPLSREALLSYALLGEELASGSKHGDNVTPCLFGGLTLTRSLDPVDVIQIPVPDSIRVVLIHPHYRVDTRLSRLVLKKQLPLTEFVQQSANLAGFLAGCYTADIHLIGRCLKDVLIEPRRAVLLPGFEAAKAAALEAKALGCSISGSGPSIFAWCADNGQANLVREKMVAAYQAEGILVDSWVSPIATVGVRRITLN